MAGTIRPSLTQPAEQFQATEPSRPRATRNLLNLPASPPWYYKHHPARWAVMDGEILPVLGTLRVEPGLNAVDKRGDTALAEAEAKRRGWTVIPWEAIRLTMPERSTYLKAYEGRSGKVHLSCWETPRAVGARVTIHSDTEGYRTWLRALVEGGVIPAPDPDVVAGLVEQAQAVVSRNETDPAKLTRLKRATERLAQVEAAAAAYLGDGFEPEEAEPTPTKSRKAQGGA